MSEVTRRARSAQHSSGRTSAGPVGEVLDVLAPASGELVVDCTTGWAGHAAELLRRVGAEGRLLGFDLDPDNLPKARERLEAVGFPFTLHHGNFAALAGGSGRRGQRR